MTERNLRAKHAAANKNKWIKFRPAQESIIGKTADSALKK